MSYMPLGFSKPRREPYPPAKTTTATAPFLIISRPVYVYLKFSSSDKSFLTVIFLGTSMVGSSVGSSLFRTSASKS
jgi:hypothetical protein